VDGARRASDRARGRELAWSFPGSRRMAWMPSRPAASRSPRRRNPETTRGFRGCQSAGVPRSAHRCAYLGLGPPRNGRRVRCGDSPPAPAAARESLSHGPTRRRRRQAQRVAAAGAQQLRHDRHPLADQGARLLRIERRDRIRQRLGAEYRGTETRRAVEVAVVRRCIDLAAPRIEQRDDRTGRRIRAQRERRERRHATTSRSLPGESSRPRRRRAGR
jgi:hypothetical protein